MKLRRNCKLHSYKRSAIVPRRAENGMAGMSRARLRQWFESGVQIMRRSTEIASESPGHAPLDELASWDTFEVTYVRLLA